MFVTISGSLYVPVCAGFGACVSAKLFVLVNVLELEVLK